MRVQTEHLSGGLRGTDQTVRKMISLLKRSLDAGMIRLFTLDVLRSSRSSKAVYDRAKAVFSFVIANIAEVPDPLSVETVQSPEATLELGAGDCDDQALLIAAMLESIGIPTRFKVIGTDAKAYSHVFAEMLIEGKWEAVDTLAPGGLPDLSGYPYSKTFPIHAGEENMNGVSGYYTFVQNPTPRQAATIDSTIADLWRHWNAGELSPEMIAGLKTYMNAGEGPYSIPEFRAAALTGVEIFADQLRAQGVPVEIAGVGFLNFLWSGVKYIAVDVVWNNVKKIWEGSEITLPDIDVSGPSVTVEPRVTGTDIGAGLSAGLNNPIVIAVIAGGLVWLISRK